jgi:ribosome biogenesis GTPase
MKGELLAGQVVYGSNNIYTVQSDGRLLQCRIKGKVLKTAAQEYNPLAVGDDVLVQPDPLSQEVGWIVQRRERRAQLSRWNNKRKTVQVMAANAELLVCVSSTQSPPFRPRFIDRVLVSCEAGAMEPVVALNKVDLPADAETRARVSHYRELGYRVLSCSALSGKGLSELKEVIRGKTAVFFGQSGVGKSSLLNRLFPDLQLPVGDISMKYDRGSHTTSYTRLFSLEGGFRVIDTPGIREFEVAGVDPEQLRFYFREFERYSSECAYPSCRHFDEPECAVRQAVDAGEIHEDRYESYLRIYTDLQALYEEFHGSPYP